MIFTIFTVLFIIVMIGGFIEFAEKSPEDKEKIFFFWLKIFLIIANVPIIYRISFEDYSVVKSWDEFGNYFSTPYFAKTIISILTSIGAYFSIIQIEKKIGRVLAKKYDKIIYILENSSPFIFAKATYKKVLSRPIIIYFMKFFGVVKENRKRIELGENYFLFQKGINMSDEVKENVKNTLYDFSAMTIFLFFIFLYFFNGVFFYILLIIGFLIWLFFIVLSFGITIFNTYPELFSKFPDILNNFINKQNEHRRNI